MHQRTNKHTHIYNIRVQIYTLKCKRIDKRHAQMLMYTNTKHICVLIP